MPAKKGSKAKSRKKKEDALEKRVEHFGEEVGTLGENFGKRMEKGGKEWDSWFHRTFGVIGPLISGIFGIIILVLFIWVINLVNTVLSSGFLAGISAFLEANVGFFFLIMLFFSYSSYISKSSPRAYRPFWPIITAVGIVIAFWMVAEALGIANASLGMASLSYIGFYIKANLFPIFIFFAFILYIALIVSCALKIPCCGYRQHEERIAVKKQKPAGKITGLKKDEIHRLYRSGKDRILGGVCGGIAEYLGVDPVLIRLLWVIGTLAWGAGILFYIIAWIIIPRNPDHRWRD